MSRSEDVARFYGILDELSHRLGGPRRLGACTSRSGWPDRGVYFFFETLEERTMRGSSRVVRVGTHALTTGSRTTLWKRLSQHRGPASSGSGNHRGSIFRLLVGEALFRRDGRAFPSWGVGQSIGAAARKLGTEPEALRTSERTLEAEVSQVIGAMNVLWVDVPDAPGADSLRGLVERNSIALLSSAVDVPVDVPSPIWLGRHSGREAVRRSGLWNVNHVEERYEPGFLDVLERLAIQTARGGS
jgi:hypothetical protein